MLCIIQARISSKRLPSKMLKKIINRTLLERVIIQIQKVKKIKKVIVATSNHKSDDPIANYCKKKGIEFYRGPLNNVTMRFYEVIKKFNFRSFLRVNGDSPLIDFKLIEYFIKIYEKNNYDILTNACPKSFPKGQSIEIINSNLFKKEFKNIKSRGDLEHVFTYFYKNKSLFKIKNISCKKNLNKLNFSIDTYKDLLRVRNILIKYNNVTPNFNKLTNSNMKLYY
jgi:spore coat polysaccharide biosynthesis protein SpsF (cytidylyltransferase family)